MRAVDAAGESRFFDAPDRKQAADWVVKRFGREGVSCPCRSPGRLVELVGEDMGDLAPEVEKLIVFARGEAPEVEDVEALVPPQVEIKPWEITDALGEAGLGVDDRLGRCRHRRSRVTSTGSSLSSPRMFARYGAPPACWNGGRLRQMWPKNWG